MKNLFLIICIPILISNTSCQSARTPEESAVEAIGTENDQPGELVLTREQFDALGMKVGPPAVQMFSNEINVNGVLSAALSGRAEINTLVAGRVSQVNYTVGDRVKKGDVLFLLESYEIIQLQQEYTEVVHQLTALTTAYERQKSLSDEKIVAEKRFRETESNYRTMQARAEGLKAQLKMIRINPEEVKKGNILSKLSVHSPIRGLVTRQELVLGQFIDPGVSVMEVIDPMKLQLTLRVFENDYAGLAKGQTVKFYIPARKDKIFEATLSHIGSSIDPETKTIQCIAQLQEGDRGKFTNNLYVESRIITCQREARAIPENALIREADRDFVWVQLEEKNDLITFRKIPVHTGVTRRGYTEILDEELSKILLEGAYNLLPGE